MNKYLKCDVMKLNLIILLLLIVSLMITTTTADSFHVYVMDKTSNDFVHLNITGDNLTITEVREMYGTYIPTYTLNESERTINCYGFTGTGTMK